jgi:hypothetical protein
MAGDLAEQIRSEKEEEGSHHRIAIQPNLNMTATCYSLCYSDKHQQEVLNCSLKGL